MNHIAEKLKKARKKSGYSQLQVSLKLNISRSNISKYENGLLEPNLSTMQKLIKLYNVDANYIFDTEENLYEQK